MAVNRTLYLLSLLGCLGFYFASGVWFSWAAVFVLLLLPVVSLLCSLPQMLRLRVSVEAPADVEVEQQLGVRLVTQAIPWLPMCELRLRLKFHTVGDAKKELRHYTHIPRQGGTVWLDTAQAGLLCAQTAKIRVYDYLGLIWLPKRTPSAAKTAVLPKPVQPTKLPELTLFRSVQLQPLPAGSFSELHDHRPYREGDNARSIHWKLSQKSDELIVREPVAPVRLRSHLILTPPTSLGALQSELAQLRWLSDSLLAQEIEHTVLWLGETGVQARQVTNEAEAHLALIAACSAPIFAEGAVLSAPEADWCYRIVPEREVCA